MTPSTTKSLSLGAIRNVLFTQYSTAWKVLAESEEREFTQEHQLSLWGYLKGLSFALHVAAVDHSACEAHPLAEKLQALDHIHP